MQGNRVSIGLKNTYSAVRVPILLAFELFSINEHLNMTDERRSSRQVET